MEKYSKMENLISFFETLLPETIEGNHIRRLPIMYYIKGVKQKGLDYIERINRESKVEPIFSEHYVEYYKALD